LDWRREFINEPAERRTAVWRGFLMENEIGIFVNRRTHLSIVPP